MTELVIARTCTECGNEVLGGYVFRDRFWHLGCLAPYALAALASDTVSLHEAQRADELLEIYVRGRLAEAQRRARHEALANGLRNLVGLPAKPGGEP